MAHSGLLICFVFGGLQNQAQYPRRGLKNWSISINVCSPCKQQHSIDLTHLPLDSSILIFLHIFEWICPARHPDAVCPAATTSSSSSEPLFSDALNTAQHHWPDILMWRGPRRGIRAAASPARSRLAAQSLGTKTIIIFTSTTNTKTHECRLVGGNNRWR